MGGNHFSGLALRMITLPRTKIYQSIKAVKREGGGGEQDGREELEGRHPMRKLRVRRTQAFLCVCYLAVVN